MLAALFLLTIVSSAFAGYRPRTPRYYNWLDQHQVYIYPDVPVIGDERYPQHYPEMGADFGGPFVPNDFMQLNQDYDPLEHYPYVNDPYEGYGPSSQEEDHRKQELNPEDQYPYVNDPYEGEGPQYFYQQHNLYQPSVGRNGLNKAVYMLV